MIDQQELGDLIGIRVRHECTAPDEIQRFEYGMLTQAWNDEDMQAIDCYIAFYGFNKYKGKPANRHEVLRYFLSSVTLLDGDWEPVRIVK